MQSSRKRFLTGTKVARNREIIEIVKVEKNREKNKERVVNREKNKERVVNIQGTWLLVHDTEKFKREHVHVKESRLNRHDIQNK